jgi:hypothetical protein
MRHLWALLGYKGINWPLGDHERCVQRLPHKFALLVFTLAKAIKKLWAWTANADNAHQEVDMFRGMSNKKIFDTLWRKKEARTWPSCQLLPTSGLLHNTTRTGDRGDHQDLAVASHNYSPAERLASRMALGLSPREGVRVFAYIQPANLQTSLTYLQPTGRAIETTIGSSTYKIVEVQPTFA